MLYEWAFPPSPLKPPPFHVRKELSTLACCHSKLEV